MSNKLSQIIVVILSMFLAFSCVYFHADTIFSTLNVEENSIATEPMLEKNSIEDATMKQEVVVIKEKKKMNVLVEQVKPHNSKPVEDAKSFEIATEENELDSLEKRMLEALKEEEGR